MGSVSVEFLLLALGAALFGVLVTVFVQWTIAIRTLSSEVAEASRHIGEVALRLKPAAERIDHVSRVVAESEPDVRRTQLALRNFSETSLELSENIARVSKWIAFATPIAAAAIEHLTRKDTQADAAPPSRDEAAEATRDDPPRSNGTVDA